MDAILYCRFSPRPDRKLIINGVEKIFPAKQHCKSNEVQEARCRAWCEAEGYPVAEVYRDVLESGGSLNRTTFPAAVEHVKRIHGILVCYSLSRFARNARDALNLAHELEQSRAHLALLDFKMDTATSHGRLMFTIFAAFAQFQKELGAETTSDHMISQQDAGKRVSRYPPFGYRLVKRDKSRIEPSEAELVVIERITSLKSEGYGSLRIKQQLEALGILCRGKPWHRSTIEKILARTQT
jgi:site-specific DNA recombinase